jgi:outer membrane protein OmpA-like peptidoglycan-associated protein
MAYVIHREDQNLKGWIFLALFLSLGLHLLLYLTAPYWIPKRAPAASVLPKPERDRVYINPENVINKQTIRNLPNPTNISEEPDIKSFQTDSTLYNQLRNADVNNLELSPTIKKIENWHTQTTTKNGANPNSVKENDTLFAADESKLNQGIGDALTSSSLKPKLSDQQLTLVGDESLSDATNKSFVSSTLPGSGSGIGGFSDLDALLNNGGKVGVNTAPIRLPTDLLFEYGSATLAESAKLSLMNLGFLILKNPESLFVIEGHTDNFGGADYNLDLSLRRAQAVTQWLQESLDIPADRIRAMGMGKTKLIANPQGSVEEQAINRRVEIKIKARQP